ncbi:hypothetical protein EVAR_17221_1 [Eumeta japonica]|uniref:Uncharacterized protein n=1 Tax=Eumeta variegata TaxID=151549 RepID=A0A4C1U9X6_EUMVA|nr:hypothetical protein EVAR_17221_1 [Eumeta japonica]
MKACGALAGSSTPGPIGAGKRRQRRLVLMFSFVSFGYLKGSRNLWAQGIPAVRCPRASKTALSPKSSYSPKTAARCRISPCFDDHTSSNIKKYWLDSRTRKMA